MRSLRKVFGPRPSACGFSSAETWFPVKHQDSPLSEASRDLCFVVSGIGTDGRGFACVTLDRNTLIYIAGSQCVGGWVSINGSSHQAQSSPLFKSPFPGSFGSLSSFLWLNPVYLKLGVIARERNQCQVLETYHCAICRASPCLCPVALPQVFEVWISETNLTLVFMKFQILFLLPYLVTKE